MKLVLHIFAGNALEDVLHWQAQLIEHVGQGVLPPRLGRESY